jgi:RNA polymerase primary sigma factor
MTCDWLVCHLAIRYGAKPWAVKDSWQYSAGWCGLMRAVEKFDPGRGATFATYAHWWIRQGITRQFQEKKAAKRGGGTVRTVAFSQIGEAEAGSAEAALATSLDPDPLIDERAAAAELWRVLSPRAKEVVERHVCGGETLEAVGATLGVTRERVRQICVKAMDKLRRQADRLGIKPPEGHPV